MFAYILFYKFFSDFSYFKLKQLFKCYCHFTLHSLKSVKTRHKSRLFTQSYITLILKPITVNYTKILPMTSYDNHKIFN